MRGENSLGISWEDLEDEDVDPLELEGLPCKPTTSEKKSQYQRQEWVLQYKDKQYLCPLKFRNLGFFIRWIMNWRKKQGYLNENFTWIKCSQEENEIFVYDKINLGFRSMKIYRERRFELEHFMADVVYQRVRPLPEKVVIGGLS